MNKRMKTHHYVTCLLMILGSSVLSTAQEGHTNKFKEFFTTNTEYQIRGQFSIGGSTPLGFPAQIREVNSYNPTMQLGLEANITKWLTDDHKWGFRTGLRMEGRGMKTDARVKNYYTKLDEGDGKYTKGYFTGNVKTTMKNSYITFPILLTYNVSSQWNTYGGFYFSGLIDRDFTGYVYNGVLREDSPIGTPVEFEGNARGDYDFSDDLNRFQFGIQVGGEYKLNAHLRLFGDLNWGLNQVFKKDFDAITFKMYNIYANIGFAYQF